MFEDVLQHAEMEDKDEDGNKEEEVEVELEKDESSSSRTEKLDKTEPDAIEMEDKPEPVTVEMEDKPELVIVTLNEEPLDHSEMCEESVETPDVSSAMDEEKELHGEGEIEEKQEIATVGAEDDFLTLPPSCILSPLSKSVEAVVTPLVYWPGFRYLNCSCSGSQ